MDKFKHIDDTTFPEVQNVDVFAYKNTFDYNRWDIDTEIRLLDVPWDGFDNAIAFEDEIARNTWIDEHTREIYTLDTEQYLQPDGTIKLPIPFNVACLYNYIAVKYPTAPVDYGNNDRLDRFFYFITNVQQLAPSTTECTLMLDAWTTYQHRIEISHFMLERGHAPMAEISAEHYIQNPIKNAGNILAPDVNFAGAANVRGGWQEASQHISIGKWIANNDVDDMYLVLALNGAPGAWWGDVNTSSMHVESVVASTFFGALGYCYIAMKATIAWKFIEGMFKKRPQMAQTIKSIFYAPGKLLTLENEITLFDVKCNYIQTRPKYYNLATLNLDMFNYDQKYRNIAKLYTYPYAKLELTDERGNVSTIPIEQTNGNFKIQASLNLFAPFLGLDIMPLSVGGGAEEDVSFAMSEGRTMTIGGAWYQHIMHWNIPAYAIYMSQEYVTNYSRFFQNKQARTALENARSNAWATNNTTQENAFANADCNWKNARATNNTTHENALANADCNWKNARATNNTTQENALANADNNWKNGKETNEMQRDTTARSVNTGYWNSEDGANATYDNAITSKNLTEYTTQQNIASNSGLFNYAANEHWANTAGTMAAQGYGQYLAADNTGISVGTTLASGAASAAIGFGTGGPAGSVAGAIAGAGFSGVSQIAAQSNNQGYMNAIGTNQTTIFNRLYGGAVAYDSDKTAAFYINNYGGPSNNSLEGQKTIFINGIAADIALGAENATQAQATTNRAEVLGGQGLYMGTSGSLLNGTNFYGTAKRTQETGHSNNTDRYNTATSTNNRTKTTADDNAGRWRTTSDNNANLTKTTADDNAGRHRTTADNNANLTKTTADDNAKRWRGMEEDNAERNKDTAENAIDNGNRAQWVLEPMQVGDIANADTASSRPMGVFLNIVKQSNTAIAQAGDAMLRYGYMLNASWTPTDLQPMKFFSYWKANDIWLNIDGEGTAPKHRATETIREMFSNGITLWSDPDKIGHVSIYENI